MSIPSFTTRSKQWSSPPVDDVGYIPSKDLLKLDDKELHDVIYEMETTRYHGWRNFENRWRRQLRIDETEGKKVLDYGCGTGVEALQYARLGNEVSVADISADNVALAERVLDIFGYPAKSGFKITEKPPFIRAAGRYDVINCAGVLHHIPEPIPVVEQMAKWLNENGELRLMVYSDEAWKLATKTEPPEDDVFDYVEFDAFWKHWDAVGGYADYYTRDRLNARFGEWFHVESCMPITAHGEYLGAVLRKR